MGSERSASIKLRKSAIQELGLSFKNSWKWTKPEFEKALDWLLNAPDALDHAECIWTTRHKKVYRLKTPEDTGGFEIAYKTYDGVQHFRHIFLPAQTAREASNYRMLAKLGLPMANLLAAGDFRHNYIIQSSFIVTEFAVGYPDGRQFMPGGAYRDSTILRKLFTKKNLEAVAEVHKIHCFHKSFKPYNMLWQANADATDLDLLWIDVANCHFKPPFLFKKYILKDLRAYFKNMNLPDAELREMLLFYLSRNQASGFEFNELYDKLMEAMSSSGKL